MTGSRFPDPGYKITSSSIDLTRHTRPLTNPNTGKEVKDPDNPDDPKPRTPTPTREEDQSGESTPARTSTSRGPFPVFYWPHIAMDLDDLEPPLRMIGFATNNYFGQQFKVDFNGFRLIGQRAAQVHRPLERRRRLPECPDQGLSRAGQRDGLVRHRSHPRPERSLPRGPQSA